MLASYRDLFTITGAMAPVLASLVSRMSASMMALGIVLLVSAIGASYGVAGAVAAAYGFPALPQDRRSGDSRTP